MSIAARVGPLQERQFRVFFIGQTTSLLGDGMVGVALSFAVLNLTGSVADLGFVLAAAFRADDRVPPRRRGLRRPASSASGDDRCGRHPFHIAGTYRRPAAAFFVLGPSIAKESLGGAGAWALIVSAFSAGSFVGGLVAFRFRQRRPFLTAFLLYLLYGVPCALLAVAPAAVVIAVGTCISGAGLMLGNAIWETTLQRQIPRRVLSRVTSYDWFASLALAPIGSAIVGPIALTVGLDATLWGAFAIFTTMNLVAISMKSIRNLESHRPVEAEAT